VKALCVRWKLGMGFWALKQVLDVDTEMARRPRRAIENLAAIVVMFCVLVVVGFEGRDGV
jgi:hypothetical protein